MAHLTVMFGSDGPAIDLAVAVGGSWQRQLSAQGAVVPSPLTVRALIDTGADISVVHPHVLQQLGVQPTGSIRIRRPGTGPGFRPASLARVRLSIGGTSSGTRWISTRVVGISPSTPTVLALIGRDVLAECTLFYNGPRAS
jgi:Aspartyl protease